MSEAFHPNKERIKLWVDALRSGKYKQATHALRKGDAFCCLGVACEVFASNGGGGKWDGDMFVVGDAGGRDVLPRPVREWFSLESADPRVRRIATEPESSCCLSFLNDCESLPFSEIANKIEAEYLT